jgi:hypothetical protein
MRFHCTLIIGSFASFGRLSGHSRLLVLTYWGIGGIDADKYARAYARARAAGRMEQDIPVNHSELFAPVIEPMLSTGTQALVIAALAYLAK